jgi:hypothetical protein
MTCEKIYQPQSCQSMLERSTCAKTMAGLNMARDTDAPMHMRAATRSDVVKAPTLRPTRIKKKVPTASVA